MRTIRLLLEYDGTDYVGWQRQTNGTSIQELLETALSRITGSTVTVIGAGRTDAGVHARGQVASFLTDSTRSCRELMGGCNGLLPRDIVVIDAADTAPGFHARYSAAGREYSYTIARRPTALQRRTSWLLRYSLDLPRMREATAHLAGTHNFRSFCRSIAVVDSYECTVRSAVWTEGEGFIRFDIGADRFLHGMVRAIVGTMVDVGRGTLVPEDIPRILAARDRTAAGPSAPPRGLVLEHVSYPDRV